MIYDIVFLTFDIKFEKVDVIVNLIILLIDINDNFKSIHSL